MLISDKYSFTGSFYSFSTYNLILLYLAPISTTNALLLTNLKFVAEGKFNKSIELYVPDQDGQFGAP